MVTDIAINAAHEEEVVNMLKRLKFFRAIRKTIL